MNNKKNILPQLVLFVGLVVIDQLSKWAVASAIPYAGKITLISHLLDLTHVHNRGAAFGLGNSWPAGFRVVFFYIISAAAIAIVGWLFLKMDPAKEKLMSYGLSMILSGAVGNLIDRVRFGYVVDFISMHAGKYAWPSYNVADAAICIGAVLICLQLLKSEKDKKGG